MSLSTTVRRQACSAGIIRRYVSSEAHKAKSHRTLPDAKMRALISLYHQADTFITPENLSDRIDAAFVPPTIDTKLGRRLVTVEDLKNALSDQRKAAKFTEWDENTFYRPRDYTSVNWSSLKTAREMKVIEALYGVSTLPTGQVLPSLEALEDVESIPKALSEEEMRDALQNTQGKPI